MEQQLTVYVIELNKRGRPPTRGEVKIMGQYLSTIPDFRASKGWLDKYLNRIKDEMKTKDEEFKELFKIISYADVKKYEHEKSIVSCLIDIDVPEEIIERFKTVNYEKPHELLNINAEGPIKQEESVESPKIIKHTSIEDSMIDYSQDKRESIFIEEDEVVLPAIRRIGSPWRSYL